MLKRAGRYDEAAAAYSIAIELEPDNPRGYVALVFAMVAAPTREPHDPSLTIQLATVAVELGQRDWASWNALGMARYRAGQWQVAVDALEKSIELQHADASQYYFLAMAHWQLGHQREARSLYKKAISWMKLNQPNDPTVGQLGAEAARLTGSRSAASDTRSPDAAAHSFARQIERLRPDDTWLRERLIGSRLRRGMRGDQMAEILRPYEAKLQLAQDKLGAAHADTLAAKFELARLYVAAGRFADADRMVANIPAEFLKRNAQAAARLSRTLAHWNGGQKRWRAAAGHYQVFMFGPAKQGWVSAQDDAALRYVEYAPLLVELGSGVEYNELRKSAIAEFGESDWSLVAERSLYACLLTPATDEEMAAMAKWAESAANVDPANQFRCWNYAALAMFEYRRGELAECLSWGQKCLDVAPPPACRARAQILMAMAYARLERPQDSKAELTDGREMVESKINGDLSVDDYGAGSWRDWLINHVLLREAANLLDATKSQPSADPKPADDRASNADILTPASPPTTDN
jgi:tetratricopeptide (TPR) repeat protein